MPFHLRPDMPSGIRFNGDRAWREGIKLLSGNRDVLIALAGVFIFLPALGMVLFSPNVQTDMVKLLPQMQNPATSTAAVQRMAELYRQIAPWLLSYMLLSEIGKAAIMALLTHQHRPTVGEALKLGIRCLPTLIGVMLIVMAFAYACSILTALAAAVAPILAAFLAMALLGFMVVAIIRLSPILPVVVVGGQRNPLHVIIGAWRLTGGNTLRLLGFYLLLFLAYAIIFTVLSMLIGMVVGIVTYAVGMGHALSLVMYIISGIISTAAVTLWVGILAAVHRQLSGYPPTA